MNDTPKDENKHNKDSNKDSKKKKHPFAFFTTSIISGLLILLPIVIIMEIFIWISDFIIDIIRPLIDVLENFVPYSNKVDTSGSRAEIWSAILAILVIILGCFLIGTFVKTRVGRKLHSIIDKLLKKIPGYNLIKEALEQFFGENRTNPFTRVVLVDVLGNNNLMTGFITDTNDVVKGSEKVHDRVTVYVPTAPNPTSGNVFHIEPHKIHYVNVTVEDAMRTIISCGAGTSKIMRAYKNMQEGKEISSDIQLDIEKEVSPQSIEGNTESNNTSDNDNINY
ncbi:MAG: DUF502 domain-containing protein [Spirochaetota bacterium]